jgi:hypothetical protein
VSHKQKMVASQDEHQIPHRSNGSTQSKAYRHQDGYAAPTAEDRADTAVLAAAEALGYRLAVRCTRCGQWVVSDKSVAAHMGPVCRAKVGDH